MEFKKEMEVEIPYFENFKDAIDLVIKIKEYFVNLSFNILI